MQKKDYIQPQPKRHYTGMELAKAWKITIFKQEINSVDKLYAKALGWVTRNNPKASIHERTTSATSITRELTQQSLNWKEFCKGAAVLGMSTEDMLKEV